MNVLFINPPYWEQLSPNAGIPILISQVQSKNHYASCMDLNVDFFHYILTPNCIELAHDKSKKILKENKCFVENHKENDSDNTGYYEKFIISQYEYLKKNIHIFDSRKYDLQNDLNKNFSRIHNLNEFYNVFKLNNIYIDIDEVFHTVLLPYYPLTFKNQNCIVDNENLTFDIVKFIAEQKDFNFYIDFYEKKMDEILQKNADMICISINSGAQLIAAITLGKMLKQKTDSKVYFGGCYFTRYIDFVENDDIFFKEYCDGIMINESELTVIELTEYLEGKREISEVSNFIFLSKENKLVKTSSKDIPPLDEMNNLSFEGYNLEQYLLPVNFLPIQATRGCYWGKCSFCDYEFEKKHSEKDVDRLIDEISFLQKKYNTNYFYFTDTCISPNYCENFSRKLLEKNIKIYYQINLRLEKNFSKKLLKQLYKSGLRYVSWGVESASKSVLKLMNKGIDIDYAHKILKDSYDVGIYNFIFLILGFPGETDADRRLTLNFVRENKKYIHNCNPSLFFMNENSYIGKHINEFPFETIELDDGSKQPILMSKSTYKDVMFITKELNELFEDHCSEKGRVNIWHYSSQTATIISNKYSPKIYFILNIIAKIIGKIKSFKVGK